MEASVSSAVTKKIGTSKITKNSKIFKTIIKAIQEKKGEQIISLDLRKIGEAVCDFFIICEATSAPQVRAIAENIEHQVKMQCGENVFRKEGIQNLQWIIMDYVNVVVHIMQPQVRAFYAIEEMWNDAISTEHQ